MNKINLLTIALLGTTALSAPALADAKDDRIAALEAQMQAMFQEIQSLKSERAAEKQEQAALITQVKTLEQNTQNTVRQLASIQPAAGQSVYNLNEDDGVKIEFKPSPKISKGEFSFQPTGRLHIDAATFQDDEVDHPDGAEFRRARLGAKGKLSKDLGYKIELEFANENVAFRDSYINYTGFDKTNIRVGNIKPPVGLEELTSSNYITFIERSVATDAFTAGQLLGIDASTHGKHWTLTGGVFNDDPGTSSSDDEAFSVAGRASVAPINSENNTLHFGVSGTYAKPDQADDTFDFDAAANNTLQSADSIAASITTADSSQLYGFEVAALAGPFSAQAEYYTISVDNNAGADASFDGGYAQASWILTGERRPYDNKKGVFGRVVPDKPLDPSTGGWGALELAGRYDVLDLNDGAISGGKLETYTAGLTWYLQKHARLMANYIVADTDDNAPTPNDDPSVFAVRAQVDF